MILNLPTSLASTLTTLKPGNVFKKKSLPGSVKKNKNIPENILIDTEKTKKCVNGNTSAEGTGGSSKKARTEDNPAPAVVAGSVPAPAVVAGSVPALGGATFLVPGRPPSSALSIRLLARDLARYTQKPGAAPGKAVVVPVTGTLDGRGRDPLHVNPRIESEDVATDSD